MKQILNEICNDPSCKGKRHYDVAVYCLACGWKGTLRRTVGHHSFYLPYYCPNCECPNLQYDH